MKKREFLAMGGAVPLMLAGCGGSGSGSAPMRLVNASVGYPLLGFMDQSTQVTTSDVKYGEASQFYNVEAGAVSLTLTVAGASATAAQTRTINKDSRYSLVAYGFVNELKLLPIVESTVTPDTGKANINVLNTSVDIGAVDVYLSTTTDLGISTLIASGVAGVSQSAFAGVLAGSYYITVVGANSVSKGISDVRFQSPAKVTLTALQVMTVILTPGASGVLANAILLTQGTAGASTQPVNDLNTTARVRAVTAIPGSAISVTGTTPTSTAVTLLPSNTTPQYSNYFVVSTGTPPVVTVNGSTVAVTMDVSTTTNGVTTVTNQAAALEAGGDYTLMVYLNGSTPTAKVVADNNTAPVTSSGVKFRLINLASNNQGLQLSMSVNSLSIASNIPFATASEYTEVSTPQAANSTVEVFNGADSLVAHTQIMTLPNIFTEIVVSVTEANGVVTVKDFFRAASGT